MYNLLYLVIAALLFSTCTSNTILKKPDNLIPKDQMVDLITDLVLAEGGKNIRSIEMERNTNFFPHVFEKYNIDSAQFQASNYYYTSRIDDYDEILAAVDLRLKTILEEYQELRKQEDSIRLKKLDSVRKSQGIPVRNRTRDSIRRQ